MKNNPYLGSDAIAFRKAIVPDTPETRSVEEQELFRLALTQAMREPLMLSKKARWQAS